MHMTYDIFLLLLPSPLLVRIHLCGPWILYRYRSCTWVYGSLTLFIYGVPTIFTYHFLSYCLEVGSLAVPESPLFGLGCLASELSGPVCFYSSSHPCWAFYMSTGYLNLGSQACSPNTLTSWATPLNPVFFFFLSETSFTLKSKLV